MGCSWDKAIAVTEDSKGGNSLKRKPTGPQLSKKHVVIIKNTWQMLKLEIANVGVNMFVRLFESHPELIETFNKFRGQNLSEIHDNGLLKSHALRVMATIDKCILHLDEMDVLVQVMVDMGRLHKGHHVTREHIQSILPHFLEAMKPHIKEYWNSELRDAWQALFAVMIYHMEVEMNGHTSDNATLGQEVLE